MYFWKDSISKKNSIDCNFKIFNDVSYQNVMDGQLQRSQNVLEDCSDITPDVKLAGHFKIWLDNVQWLTVISNTA